MTPEEALNKHRDELTAIEIAEIAQFEKVYTIGTYRVTASSTKKDGTFKAHAGEQIGYRYVIKAVCGKGAFGSVL